MDICIHCIIRKLKQQMIPGFVTALPFVSTDLEELFYTCFTGG
jgi:hypothetical protein